MNSTINKKRCENFSYPDEEEMKAAMKACCGRNCSACETPAEYAWRKRNVDLADLLILAVERELTDCERSVITDIYYDNMSSSDIAKKECISKSAVNKTRARAEEKLRAALGYVKMYQDDRLDSENNSFSLETVMQITRAKTISASSLAGRLENARISKGITLRKAGDATGINQNRIRRFETGDSVPDASELKSLSFIYNTTPDYLLDFERSRND